MYINGVWNDEASAEKNRRSLDSFLTNQNLRSRVDKVLLVYNKDHGASQDLYDVLVQKEREDPSAWKGFVNMLARYATAGPSILIETATQNNTSLGSVVSILTTKTVDSLTLKDYVDEDFIKLSADLTAYAGATNLLLLPHSQGTLYAGRLKN